jgi:opacity protein-like surface antigen
VPARGPFPATRVTDRGASGLLFGGVLGYGHLFAGGFYLGAEFELAVPDNVVSRVRVYGREMRARLTTDGGVFVRGGYSWDGSSLLFVRAGVTAPRPAFETMDGREVSNRWLVTPAIGGGAEFAVTSAIALRADVTYTFPGGENPVDSLRGTLGLSYRF